MGRQLVVFQLAPSGVVTGFGGEFLEDAKVVPACFVRADGGRDHRDCVDARVGGDDVDSGTPNSESGEVRCGMVGWLERGCPGTGGEPGDKWFMIAG